MLDSGVSLSVFLVIIVKWTTFRFCISSITFDGLANPHKNCLFTGMTSNVSA